MQLDFPIEKINFDFALQGDAKVDIIFNGESISGYTITDGIKDTNTIQIKFSKKDPSDDKCFGQITTFDINGFSFIEQLKPIEYHVDKQSHKDAPAVIPNNLYLGYVGALDLRLDQNYSQLQKAAWLIADKNFSTVKWPTKNSPYRKHNFINVKDDARFMYTGCQPPSTKEITDFLDQIKINDCNDPLDLPKDRIKIQEWINRSKRITIDNFDSMEHFTVSNGTSESLSNLLQSSDVIYMPKKVYHHHHEILADKKTRTFDVFEHEPPSETTVLFELPSPWYSTEKVLQGIDRAKQNKCKIALDLTWLSMSTADIKIDLQDIDQIFISMNKAWPIQNLRPAFRWSKKRINDTQTFDTEACSYTKVPARAFMKLIEKFGYDFAHDHYVANYKQICEQFELSGTPVLWFTKNADVKHDSENPIYKNFFLDEFVCVVKLLENKNKFFW